MLGRVFGVFREVPELRWGVALPKVPPMGPPAVFPLMPLRWDPYSASPVGTGNFGSELSFELLGLGS